MLSRSPIHLQNLTFYLHSFVSLLSNSASLHSKRPFHLQNFTFHLHSFVTLFQNSASLLSKRPFHLQNFTFHLHSFEHSSKIQLPCFRMDHSSFKVWHYISKILEHYSSVQFPYLREGCSPCKVRPSPFFVMKYY